MSWSVRIPIVPAAPWRAAFSALSWGEAKCALGSLGKRAGALASIATILPVTSRPA